MASGNSKAIVVQAALELAAREGLEGITIGRLAKQLGMSKSGVIGQFGTKEELQIAVLKHAAQFFFEEVIQPNSQLEPGLARLKGMLASWVAYAFGTSLGSGCFFHAAAFEFDGRPGKLKDMVAHLGRSWLGAISDEISTAIGQGELPGNTNPELLAFQIHGMLLQANWSAQLIGNARSSQNLGNALDLLLTTNSQFHSPIE